MPIVSTRGSRARWRRRTRRQSLVHALVWAALGAVIIVSGRVVADRTIWEFVADGPHQLADLLDRMTPPDVTAWPRLVRPLWDTVDIATLGTLAALIAGVPIAFAAARTTSPAPLVRALALAVIVVSRSVNSLIWALFLVAIFGPGALAGVLAIGVRSIGFVGKLLYEAIEEADPAPVEAIRATGAGRLQTWIWGLWPQVATAFRGLAAFRWDINIREATVLGLVGAGGIGLELQAAVDRPDWPLASAILLAILALVLVAEMVSAWWRREG